MERDHDEHPRRQFLIQALAAGLYSTLPAEQAQAAWSLFGEKPKKMPASRSIYRLTGSAWINGKKANPQSIIRPGDTVETGKSSEMIFVVNTHSMIIRSETRLEIEREDDDDNFILSGLRLLAGKLLSVSRNTPIRVSTLTATIGIRGTGWYAEADPEQTYFCTCYGTTRISANQDPLSEEIVNAKHHDRPLYILNQGNEGELIREAPFINHTDQELMLIEALAGREPPFVFSKDDYSGPRRDY